MTWASKSPATRPVLDALRDVCQNPRSELSYSFPRWAEHPTQRAPPTTLSATTLSATTWIAQAIPRNMPELPEVETMRRGILPVIGQTIEQVGYPPCRLKPIQVGPTRATFRRRVAGQRIDQVDRVGKRILIRLQDADCVVIEPRMTGLVLIADPPNQTHLRVSFRFTCGPVEKLLFWDRRGLGSIRVLSELEVSDELGPERIGPDALAISLRQFKSQLCGSRREIKVALLDQRAIAGIGNLYASEMLFDAAIHPQRRCDQLAPSMWSRLHQSMRRILAEAIRYEGSTLGDGTYRNALNQDGSYQNKHQVYKRAGLFCARCGYPGIQRIVQAQRATFYCPHCQPAPRRAPPEV